MVALLVSALQTREMTGITASLQFSKSRHSLCCKGVYCVVGKSGEKMYACYFYVDQLSIPVETNLQLSVKIMTTYFLKVSAQGYLQCFFTNIDSVKSVSALV